ncbi:hypothetical protein ACT3TS_02425 [Specibacter sp. AOP5-B1-6]|uniref:hypothetical protein n=1 Tax=Specibacter sp. AOP5-B1-6 TaxID=3457653 RepID=UPI00402BAD93
MLILGFRQCILPKRPVKKAWRTLVSVLPQFEFRGRILLENCPVQAVAATLLPGTIRRKAPLAIGGLPGGQHGLWMNECACRAPEQLFGP